MEARDRMIRPGQEPHIDEAPVGRAEPEGSILSTGGQELGPLGRSRRLKVRGADVRDPPTVRSTGW